MINESHRAERHRYTDQLITQRAIIEHLWISEPAQNRSTISVIDFANLSCVLKLNANVMIDSVLKNAKYKSIQ